MFWRHWYVLSKHVFECQVLTFNQHCIEMRPNFIHIEDPKLRSQALTSIVVLESS